jgi:hypothetical protein
MPEGIYINYRGYNIMFPVKVPPNAYIRPATSESFFLVRLTKNFHEIVQIFVRFFILVTWSKIGYYHPDFDRKKRKIHGRNCFTESFTEKGSKHQGSSVKSGRVVTSAFRTKHNSISSK